MEEKLNSFYAKSGKAWRAWLAKNHLEKESVWLIIYKKDAGIASVYYPEAVEHALCFGWIDSLANKRDGQSYYQYFSKRTPTSNWSKVYKGRVATLIEKGLMAPKGLEMVELAQRTGTWTVMEAVEDTIMPADLKKLFNKNKTALKNWHSFSKSSKSIILGWILQAKRAATREKRITETVRLAAMNIKANHPVNKGTI